MRRRWLLLGCAGVAWLGACGAGDETLAPGCTDRAEVARVLAAPPGDFRVSRCVQRATTPAQLQNVGVTLTAVAEDLEDRAATDPEAALQLGRLIGAVRRGAARGDGRGAELARRLERTGAGIRDPEALDALLRGLREGEASG